MGSVVPLLAVVESLKDKQPDIDCYWLGTKHGPEAEFIKNYNIDFKAIAAGKMRRYLSWQNLADIFKVLAGFFQALVWLWRWRPQVIVSAGGYVAVPVVWAGWLLGIPSLIHQQDVRPGLANKLCARAARKITVCFDRSAKYFKARKTEIVGNPVREALRVAVDSSPKKRLKQKYGLREDMPLVLIMGGGTGSMALNKLTIDSLDELVKFVQVAHISGGRLGQTGKQKLDLENYYHYEFLVDNTDFLWAAEVVVSRAGMGSLTEVAYLSKPAVIIPIPDSHQEDNADYFFQHGGVVKLSQANLDKNKFVKAIKTLVVNRKQAQKLGQRVHQLIKWGAEERIAEIVIGLAVKSSYS